MSNSPPPRARILAEIERLKRELEARRKAPRPAPTSVVRAYQQLLQQHYDRLDGADNG
jgi:hypothetical protein